MKIAIHHKDGGFSGQWIDYCERNKKSYKLVDAYSNDIIHQLEECDVFFWHFSNHDYRDALFAKQLLYSVQRKGLKVFPDFNTCWHFDDKVGQKYLLESIKAPLVPSYVFYTKRDALSWIESTDFPKVFKLRGGSGSSNVQLVATKRSAAKFINKSFGRGFSQFDRLTYLKYRFDNVVRGVEAPIALIRGIGRAIAGREYSNMSPRDIGYVYFQEFIPGNTFDTRVVIVLGKWAFAEKRFVRRNDFRASGSGEYSYDDINMDAVKVAFEVSKALRLQSVAFDFVIDGGGNPLIVEVSYGFGTKGLEGAPGYWDDKLSWHKKDVQIADLMIGEVIKDIE